ncbi:MAG: hypothetical protein J6P16_00265 [Eubacterium sp.]|nr:hypothetical protein [Eubacterium sp.]
MNLYLVANLIVCVCAFVAFVIGAMQFFRPRKALYGQMITLAMLCIVIGRLFNIVRIASGGDLQDRFQLGFLGIIGSFMFFFSSNYGTLDSLVDDKSKEYRKYRLIGMLAPIAFLASYYPLFMTGEVSLMWRFEGGVLIFFTALCSYFHLKHLIFPDIDYGVVRSLRPYNFLALLYMLSSTFECYALSRDNEVLTLVACICSSVFLIIMMPLISRGLKRWKVRRAKN